MLYSSDMAERLGPDFGPVITGIGMDAPEIIRDNKYFEQLGIGTSDEWIRKNTGIERRHIASFEQATSDLATIAAEKALAMAKVERDEIDHIVVATATPDMNFPSTACFVQRNLQAVHAGAHDELAACSGFIYALAGAFASHVFGMDENSLVIGAETLSRITNPRDRSTGILFGDGAGAVVVQNRVNPGLACFIRGADGSKTDLLMLPGGGSRFPASRETIAAGLHYIKMDDGPAVFNEAVDWMAEVAERLMQKAGLTKAQIDLLIPHQANIRIMRRVAKRLGIPEDKLVSIIGEYGNTSAASIPMAMCEAYEQGRIHKDDIIVLLAFGGGLTYAGAAIQSHLESPHKGIREKIRDVIPHHQTEG